MKWSCPDLLSLYPEDAKGTGWEKVGLSAVRRNGQHGSAANGSGRPLIGRRAQPHSRMKLRVQWKGVLPKTTNQLDLQGEHGMSDIKFSKLKIETQKLLKTFKNFFKMSKNSHIWSHWILTMVATSIASTLELCKTGKCPKLIPTCLAY